MSWNGTLRCSHCHESGHNKRGCETLKTQIAERRVADPDDWRVKNHDRHRAYTSRKGETRSCTYCDATGHNRRTCAALKGHVAALQKIGVAWRRAFVAALQTSAIGTGSILVNDGWRGKKRYLVTGINWENLSYIHRNRRALKVRNLAQLTQGEFLCALPRLEMFSEGDLSGTSTDGDITVLGAKGNITPPAGWVDEGMSEKQAKLELKECRSCRFEGYYEEAKKYL